MNGGSGSKLSYNQIQSFAGDLQSSATEMERILNEVKMEFNKIGTDNVWSGTAAAETKREFDTLSAKFPEFHQAIEDCYKYLNAMLANYQAVDKAIMGK